MSRREKCLPGSNVSQNHFVVEVSATSSQRQMGMFRIACEPELEENVSESLKQALKH